MITAKTMQQARPEEFTNASDIDIRHIGENLEVGSSKQWFHWRRVVALDVLARSMNCEKCNSWLRLSDVVDEVVYGMASYLYTTCAAQLRHAIRGRGLI